MSLGDQTRTQRRQALDRPRLQSVILSVTAGLLVFLGSVTRGPERFVWDATTYWRGSASLAHGNDPYVVGALKLRGALTPLLYFPAALVDRDFGGSSGEVAVLVENSLLISLVGVLLLPWLLRAWVPVTSWMVWVCAGLTWLVLGRLAPFPLTDLWGAALMLAAVVVLRRRTALALTGAGLLAGIAFNVRPAYLVPLLLALAVVVLHRRFAGLWFAAGVFVALVPQSIMNITHGVGWKPWPSGMLALTQLQSYNASYLVRYDTAAYGLARDPRQYFCSPVMAQAVGDHPPDSTVSLIVLYLHHLPQSLVFLSEKAAAAVHWPLSFPYFAPAGVGDQPFALLVTAVVVVGVASLVHARSTHGPRSMSTAVWVALVVWLGSLATIVTPSPETRFAMPLVLFGIAGCAALAGRKLRKRWVAGVVIAVAVVFAIGAAGLSHPAAPGSASPSVCAVT